LGVQPTTLSKSVRLGPPLVAALIAAAALSGCAGTAPTPTTPPTSSTAESTTATAAPDTTAPNPAPTTTAAPAPAGTRACKAADLSLALVGDEGGGGMMKQAYNLRFTNRSQSACQLWGSPGVSFVTGDNGQQVGEPATRIERSKGKQVVINPGATASSPLTITNPNAYPPEKCGLTQARGLRVYAPGDTASMFVDSPQQACASLGSATMSVGAVD
jgi:hypothetical protein